MMKLSPSKLGHISQMRFNYTPQKIQQKLYYQPIQGLLDQISKKKWNSNAIISETTPKAVKNTNDQQRNSNDRRYSSFVSAKTSSRYSYKSLVKMKLTSHCHFACRKFRIVQTRIRTMSSLLAIKQKVENISVFYVSKVYELNQLELVDGLFEEIQIRKKMINHFKQHPSNPFIKEQPLKFMNNEVQKEKGFYLQQDFDEANVKKIQKIFTKMRKMKSIQKNLRQIMRMKKKIQINISTLRTFCTRLRIAHYSSLIKKCIIRSILLTISVKRNVVNTNQEKFTVKVMYQYQIWKINSIKPIRFMYLIRNLSNSITMQVTHKLQLLK